MAIKRCKASFSVSVRGVPRVVTVGSLVDADDPVVRGREHLFEDVETHMSDRAPQTEEATAAPGERRSLLPGRTTKKTAARKPAAKSNNDSADGPSSADAEEDGTS